MEKTRKSPCWKRSTNYQVCCTTDAAIQKFSLHRHHPELHGNYARDSKITEEHRSWHKCLALRQIYPDLIWNPIYIFRISMFLPNRNAITYANRRDRAYAPLR
jgi:hypothetical protein